MSLLSPFAGLKYEGRDEDLVRYRTNPIDETLSLTVRAIADALDARREDVRAALGDEDIDVLVLFARRRALSALRDGSPRATTDALDAYALLAAVNDVPWESWFKATLVIARGLGLDEDAAHERFVAIATEAVARRAHIAFDALTRVNSLGQCHVVEVHTSYGAGLFETTIVRDEGAKSWGGITGIPVVLGQYAVPYSPTTDLAQLCVDVADALDASGRVRTSPVHQDQLVATAFDLVESGSYLDSLGCLGFFADGLEEQPTFAVVVAELAHEEYDGVRYEAEELARELAESADAIDEQSALSVGPCVMVLSALPDFDEGASPEPVDLTAFREILRGVAASRALD